MNGSRKFLTVACAVFALAACSQKEPARTAIDAGEDALASVHEQAQKYIPGRYAEVKATLDTARKAFDEEKYVEAIETVKDVPARARELGEAAAAARDALAAEIAIDWARLSATMPQNASALEDRLAELGKARRLPEGVDGDVMERARAGLDVVRGAWDQATAAFQAGNLEGAVARGQEAERLVRELMESLGIEAPAAG